MSNLSRATYRVMHSLRRKAAGEHTVSTDALIVAFATEWALSPNELAQLVHDVRLAEAEIADRMMHPEA